MTATTFQDAAGHAEKLSGQFLHLTAAEKHQNVVSDVHIVSVKKCRTFIASVYVNKQVKKMMINHDKPWFTA